MAVPAQAADGTPATPVVAAAAAPGSRMMMGAPPRSGGHADAMPHGMGSSLSPISGAPVKRNQVGCGADAGVVVPSRAMHDEQSVSISGGRRSLPPTPPRRPSARRGAGGGGGAPTRAASPDERGHVEEAVPPAAGLQNRLMDDPPARPQAGETQRVRVEAVVAAVRDACAAWRRHPRCGPDAAAGHPVVGEHPVHPHRGRQDRHRGRRAAQTNSSPAGEARDGVVVHLPARDGGNEPSALRGAEGGAWQ